MQRITATAPASSAMIVLSGVVTFIDSRALLHLCETRVEQFRTNRRFQAHEFAK